MEQEKKKKEKVGAQCLIDDVERTMYRTSKKNQPPFSGSSEQLPQTMTLSSREGWGVGFALPSAPPGLTQGFCTNVQHQSTQKYNKSQASNSHKIRGRRRRSSATDRKSHLQNITAPRLTAELHPYKTLARRQRCGPPSAKTHICCV